MTNRREQQARAFDQHRGALTDMAYRMVGSLADAEDLVQDTYVRFDRARGDEIRAPRAWLTTTLTRLCIDYLRSARVRREQYVGPWLPEPVVTDGPSPLRDVELADSLSLALMLVLERLSPPERAAFVLRESFGLDYGEIASILERSEATCRQLVSRAKKHLSEDRPRFDASSGERDNLLMQFGQAAQTGDLDNLVSLLAEDAVLWSDGGGKVRAALNPIRGATNVARFILGVRDKQPDDAVTMPRSVNGETGFVRYVNGEPFAVITFTTANGKVCGIQIVNNPDKLRNIPRLQ